MKQRVYGLIVALSLTLLLIGGGLFLLNQPTQPLPPTPTPGDDPLATVNGETIGVNEWAAQYLLDQSLSRLSGRPAPTPRQTLDRLINEKLLLQSYPQPVPDEAQVAQQIAALQASWHVDWATLTQSLKTVGLPAAVFTDTVRRLLMVQAAQAQLSAEHDPAAWFAEMREKGRVTVDEARLSSLVAPSPR